MKPRNIAGTGADIFAPTEVTEAETTPKPRRRKKVTIKEMVYLPAAVSQALARCWLERKQQDRTVTKSQIVTLALCAYLNLPPE